MDALLFHPKVVHVPIALGLLMPLVAGGLLLAWWRDWLPRRGWLIAVGLQALLVGSGLVAMQSGEVEEENVESVVSEQYIEAHEEAAEVFVWASGAVLLLMLGAAAIPSTRTGLAAATVATLGTLVVLGFGYQTGKAGGELVYEHGAAQAYVTATPGTPLAAAERSHHEDDDD